VPPEAFAIAVAIAASASFLTPIGYQTNLMVVAAGGYRFSDFIKTGLHVNLIVAVIAVTMIWLIWL
jgi:di/tricarboxylate transporter